MPLPIMMTNADSGAASSVPNTDENHFVAAERVVFQPVIISGIGATDASRISVIWRAASMPHNARMAIRMIG